jgi:DNA-binding transcriptional ArsR family regulator
MPRNNQDKPKEKFGGYQSPHYTIVPDELFDEQMAELSGPELKVLLYIIRHTYGFKKDNDNISISQMLNGIIKRDGTRQDKGCGLSKPTLLQALRDLQERNLIIAERRMSRERGNEPTNYRLNVLTEPVPQVQSPPLVKDLYQGVGKGVLPTPWSKDLTTQDTREQETTRQETIISNRFDGDANLQQTSNSKFSKKQRKFSAKPTAETEDPPQRTQRNGFAPIAEVLSSRVGKLASRSPKTGSGSAGNPKGSSKSHAEPDEAASRSRGRPKKFPVPPDLEQFTKDITLEFHDSSKLASNLSFVGRVLEESGLDSAYLYQLMQEARTLTKQRGNIEKPSEDDVGSLNKFPYFRQTLLDLIEKEGRVVSARRNNQGRQSGVI